MTIDKQKIYTNGLYVIKGKLTVCRNPKKRRLKGKIIDIIITDVEYCSSHKVGEIVDFRLYRISKDEEPQFYLTEQQIREHKIDNLLK